MAFSDLNRELRSVENATAAEMLRLLDLAAAEVERRLGELPLTGTRAPSALVYRQVEASINDAINRTNFAMQGVMQDGGRDAARLGTQMAEASLTAGGVPAVPFSLPTPLVQQLAVYEASLITGLTDALRAEITQTIQLGILSGAPTDEIIRNVVASGLEPGSPFQSAGVRAEVIARTEVNRIANLASYERGKAASESVPGLTKTWRTARDARVRPSHVALEGKTLAYEETFSVGGYPAKHPHDATLPAKEAVQCRCRLTYHAPAE